MTNLAQTTKRTLINIVFDDGTSYTRSLRPRSDRKSIFNALDKMAIEIKADGGIEEYHPLKYRIAELEAEVAELKAQKGGE